MVSEDWINIALNPPHEMFETIEDRVAIELIRYLRMTKMEIEKITEDKRHGDYVVFAKSTETRLRAKMAVKPNEFKVLKIFT